MNASRDGGRRGECDVDDAAAVKLIDQQQPPAVKPSCRRPDDQTQSGLPARPGRAGPGRAGTGRAAAHRPPQVSGVRRQATVCFPPLPAVSSGSADVIDLHSASLPMTY